MIENSYDAQLELEERLYGESVHKFYQAYIADDRKHYEHSFGAMAFPKKYFKVFVEAIADFKKSLEFRPIGIRVDTKAFLELFSNPVLAIIASKLITSKMLTPRNYVDTIASAIFSSLVDQHKVDQVKEYVKRTPENKTAYKHLMKILEGKGADRDRISTANTFRVICDKAGVGDYGTNFDTHFKFRVGVALIDLFWKSTGSVDIINKRINKNKFRKVIVPTPNTLEWLKKADNHAIVSNLTNYPMLCSPTDWTPSLEGGYIGRLAVTQNNKLINTYNKDYIKDYIKDYQGMPTVYTAVNAVHNTPWRINKEVYKVFDYAWNSAPDSKTYGLINSEPETLPPKRPKEYWRNEEERKAYNKEVALTYYKNQKEKGKRTSHLIQNKMCKELSKHKEFYFPQFLCTRSRMYSKVPFVSPQADDIGKALIHFKNPKKYGEHGFKWLCIQLCNTFGENDKDNIEGRVKWVLDNHENIMRTAYEPLDFRWWVKADKKNRYQFLSACFEYARYNISGLKEDFEGFLPIAMDGSNNGLQHFSAMLLDEVGGRAVNLLPQDMPSDVYGDIARVVEEMINEDLNDPLYHAEALLWQGKVNRKVTKYPVMTKPYNAVIDTFKDQLKDFIYSYKEDDPQGRSYINTEHPMKAINYLAVRIDRALKQVLIGANEIMSWFAKISDILALHNLKFVYYTPNGFPVLHQYTLSSSKRVRTVLGGFRFDGHVYNDTDRISKAKSKMALSPNFVHSMDATHLQRTVVEAYRQGIRNFAMIHDSYGTHAGNAEVLSQTLRSEFVKLYSEDHLEGFKNQVIKFLLDKGYKDSIELIPELPKRGNLNIKEVLKSEFFFL